MLAVLALVATAACSHPRTGTLPTPSPAASASSTTQRSPTATSSDFGIALVVRDYYASLQDAVHDPTHGVEALAARIDPRCPCRQIVDVLREEARKGRHASYSLSLRDLTVPNASPTGGTAFVTVVQSAGTLYDASGHAVEAIAGRTDAFVVDVGAHDGRWLITRISAR